MKNEARAGLSFLALLTLVFIVSLNLGANYFGTIGEIFDLVTGNLIVVQPVEGLNLLETVKAVLTIGLIALAASAATIPIVSMAGKQTSYDSAALDSLLAKPPIYIFGIILFEEVVARWLPMGILTKLFTGPTAFYILFFGGNLAWALYHLSNFKDAKDRNPVRVLPQFVAGLVFGYAYYKFGFWVALAAHITDDVILFATRRNGSSGHSFFVIYDALVAIAAYGYMSYTGNGIFKIIPWLTSRELSGIDGFGVIDYLVLLIFIDSLLELTVELIGLDRRKSNDSDKHMLSPGFALIAISLSVLTLFGMNWLAGFVTQDFFIKMILITLFNMVMLKTQSGSELARRWFTVMPINYLSLVAIMILGFWNGLLLMIGFYVVGYIPRMAKFLLDK